MHDTPRLTWQKQHVTGDHVVAGLPCRLRKTADGGRVYAEQPEPAHGEAVALSPGQPPRQVTIDHVNDDEVHRRLASVKPPALGPYDPMNADMTSLGLTREELRAEISEMISNAYAEGWSEAKRRPDVTDPPKIEVDWTQPGGVVLTEVWEAGR